MKAQDYLPIFLLGIIPDTFFAWLYVELSEGGRKEFIIALGILICFQIFFTFKNALASWITFRLFGRRKLSESILSHLIRYRYPKPKEEIAPRYFERVAADGGLPVSLRIVASKELGSIEANASKGFVAAVQIYAAYEDALDKYKKSNP